MNKKKIVKFFLIFFIFTLLLFIYFKFFKKDDSLNTNNQEIKTEEEVIYKSNIIKNINYTSEDLKGNKYVVLAKEGEIDLNNSDIIFLKDVTAYIILKKKEEIIKKLDKIDNLITNLLIK